MHFLFLCGLALGFLAPGHATELESTLAAARAAEAAFDSEQALALYLAADIQRPADPVILQKISRQYSDATVDEPDVAKKKRLAEQALIYAQRSRELAPTNAVSTLSLAICYGKLGLYGGVRAKIENARLVKKYAELALEQDPHYEWAYHVLGRWHYEVAQLGSTKRWLVSLIFGGLPDASTAQAVELLQRAVELAPRNSNHHIELGFAYLADHQDDLAEAEFKAGLALPSIEKHDEDAKRRARRALAGES